MKRGFNSLHEGYKSPNKLNLRSRLEVNISMVRAKLDTDHPAASGLTINSSYLTLTI